MTNQDAIIANNNNQGLISTTRTHITNGDTFKVDEMNVVKINDRVYDVICTQVNAIEFSTDKPFINKSLDEILNNYK